MDFELIRQLVLSLEYILTISVAYVVTSTSDCGVQRPFIDHTIYRHKQVGPIAIASVNKIFLKSASLAR